MAERVLIIGASGFIGSALEHQVRSAGAACLGVDRVPREGADHRRVDLAVGPEEMVRVLTSWRPDRIYHLVGGPAADPFAANVTPILHVLRALRAVPDLRPRVVVVGSAAEYGDLGPAPIREDARERPVNAYGVAKLAQTRLALAARRAGMRVTVARPFNIIGPGMSRGLAAARFAREAIAARVRSQAEITVGDLATVRDYLDVEDVARSLWTIGAPDVEDEIVNVCSGVPVSTSEVLEEILRQARAAARPRVDPSLVKGPEDIAVSVGCPDLLTAIAGARFGFALAPAVARLLSSVERSPEPT
jgi:nucleoside-diphosphate-sugar epimerase